MAGNKSKHGKKAGKKRTYKRHTNGTTSKVRYVADSSPKYRAYSGTLSMATNDSSRTTSYELTNIATGDLVTTRGSNTTLSESLFGRWNLVNNASTARYARFCILGLRGSESAADATNWSDLFVNSSFTKTAPVGTTIDKLYKINRDEYKVYMDFSVRIPGTGDGVPNVKEVQIKKRIGTLAKWVYSSSDCRSGTLWLVMTTCEESGQATSATTIDGTYSFTFYFKDMMQVP